MSITYATTPALVEYAAKQVEALCDGDTIDTIRTSTLINWAQTFAWQAEQPGYEWVRMTDVERWIDDQILSFLCN